MATRLKAVTFDFRPLFCNWPVTPPGLEEARGERCTGIALRAIPEVGIAAPAPAGLIYNLTIRGWIHSPTLNVVWQAEP